MLKKLLLFFKKSNGVAAIEVAVALPITLAAVYFTLEVAFFYITVGAVNHNISQAAKEIALYKSTYKKESIAKKVCRGILLSKDCTKNIVAEVKEVDIKTTIPVKSRSNSNITNSIDNIASSKVGMLSIKYKIFAINPYLKNQSFTATRIFFKY